MRARFPGALGMGTSIPTVDTCGSNDLRGTSMRM